MSPHAVSTPRLDAEAPSRSVVLRTRGQTHGPATRLASPNDVGQLIKPFVFLDYFEADPANGPAFGFHLHSGIATLTLILSGQAFYKETTIAKV
jgi:redox-sensitive bicupin YhaK (pirin superfamily)